VIGGRLAFKQGFVATLDREIVELHVLKILDFVEGIA